VLLLSVNCIGLLLGPFAVGALSQYAFSSHGVDSLRLRYALVIIELVSVWAACHFPWGGSLLALEKRKNFARRGELSENTL
jgi:hypothetical protein